MMLYVNCTFRRQAGCAGFDAVDRCSRVRFSIQVNRSLEADEQSDESDGGVAGGDQD